MKTILTLFLILPLFTIAQNNQKNTPIPDERLLEVFDLEYIEHLQAKNPRMIEYFNYYLDFGYQLLDVHSDKINALSATSIALDDPNNLNILLLLQNLNLKKKFDTNQYFQINESNRVLCILSEKAFVKKLNAHLGLSH